MRSPPRPRSLRGPTTPFATSATRRAQPPSHGSRQPEPPARPFGRSASRCRSTGSAARGFLERRCPKAYDSTPPVNRPGADPDRWTAASVWTPVSRDRQLQVRGGIRGLLRAFVTDGESSATSALCGRSRDKGVDAVLIDAAARIVLVVQGKYREKLAGKTEHRGDVAGFAQLSVSLCGDGPSFAPRSLGKRSTSGTTTTASRLFVTTRSRSRAGDA